MIKEGKLTTTFCALGFDHSFYSEGSEQGGTRKFQLRFDAVSLAGRTAYFTFDSGDEGARLDLEMDGPGGRAKFVLDITCATALLVIQHLEQSMLDIVRRIEDLTHTSGKPLTGHYQLFEGDLYDRLVLTAENVVVLKVYEGALSQADGEDDPSIQELKRRGIPIEWIAS